MRQSMDKVSGQDSSKKPQCTEVYTSLNTSLWEATIAKSYCPQALCVGFPKASDCALWEADSSASLQKRKKSICENQIISYICFFPILAKRLTPTWDLTEYNEEHKYLLLEHLQLMGFSKAVLHSWYKWIYISIYSQHIAES